MASKAHWNSGGSCTFQSLARVLLIFLRQVFYQCFANPTTAFLHPLGTQSAHLFKPILEPSPTCLTLLPLPAHAPAEASCAPGGEEEGNGIFKAGLERGTKDAGWHGCATLEGKGTVSLVAPGRLPSNTSLGRVKTARVGERQFP